MPRVAEFDGITISMYAADHNPPHVHAHYGDASVLLKIADGTVVAGSIPGRQLRAAQAWLAANRERMTTLWATLNP